jgi:hypothetical protein
VARVSQAAWALRGRIRELDINPLFVRPRGRGVVAGDALVVVQSGTVKGASEQPVTI